MKHYPRKQFDLIQGAERDLETTKLRHAEENAKIKKQQDYSENCDKAKIKLLKFLRLHQLYVVTACHDMSHPDRVTDIDFYTLEAFNDESARFKVLASLRKDSFMDPQRGTRSRRYGDIAEFPAYFSQIKEATREQLQEFIKTAEYVCPDISIYTETAQKKQNPPPVAPVKPRARKIAHDLI